MIRKGSNPISDIQHQKTMVSRVKAQDEEVGHAGLLLLLCLRIISEDIQYSIRAFHMDPILSERAPQTSH